MERTDVGVIEAGDGFGFALEALFARRIGGEMGRENFDSHGSVEACVAGAIDFAHAAGAEGREDFVGAELGAGSQGHRWGRL